MKQLIVTADDFGYSRQANRAIIKCFREGIVTSTSFLVNTKYFDESARLLKQNKKLDVGIHINLTEFRPLTKARALAGKNGDFIGKKIWFNGYYRHADKNEIESEINEQITKALSSGLNITHLNGHNHIHMLPNIIDIAVRSAKEYGIKYFRLPYEAALNKDEVKLYSTIRAKNAVARLHAKNKINKNGLKAAGAFYGSLCMKNMDYSKLAVIFNSIKNGTSELMVHPAYIDKEGDIFHQSMQREKEIELLTSNKTKQVIKKNNIKLTNFSKMSKT